MQQLTATGPAAKAGLRTGDVIVKVDSRVVTSATQLTAIVKAERPGDSVQLTYERGGQKRTATVKLVAAS